MWDKKHISCRVGQAVLNILRSMSRGGTPTDNPIIEALNGWIKGELYLDFGLAETENLPDLLNQYVSFFNNLRPTATLGFA